MLRCDSKIGIFLLSCEHFIADFYGNFLPVLLPVIMVQLGMSLTMCGMLVMVMSLASNLIQPFLGYFVDRHNCSWMLLVAIPLSGLLVSMFGYVPNQPLLFILCALLGSMVAVMHPVGTTLLGKVSSYRNLGKSMSFYIAGGNIGFAIAPVIVTAILAAYDIKYLPVMAIPGIALALGMYFVKMHTLSTANEKARDRNSDESMKLGEIFKNRSVLKINLAMGMRCWTHVAVTMFLPMLLIEQGYSKMMSGTLLGIFLIGSAAGGLLGGVLGDKFMHKRIMIYFLALGVVPIIFFFTQPVGSVISTVALFLGGACLQAPQPSSIVWTGKLMPRYIGVASGMMMGLCFAIGSVGAAVTAAMGDYIGLHTAMLLSAVPMLAGALLLIFIPYPQKAN